MIIDYVSTHCRDSSLRIPMCGEFRDWEHFRSFARTEEFRGWKITGAREFTSLESDGGVLEGTNRTTSGAIGQP